MNKKQNKLLQKIFFGNFLKYVINTIYQKALKRELNTKHFSTFCCLKNVKMLEWARFWENKCIIKKCLVSLWFEGSLQKSCFFLFDSHTSFLKLFFFNAFLTFLCICAFMANCFSCKETAETTKPFLLQCQNISKETEKPTAKCKTLTLIIYHLMKTL